MENIERIPKLKWPLFLSVLFLLCSSGAFAQGEGSVLANAEYGSIKEVLLLHKVFVVSSDLNARDIIVKELAKAPRLEVVGRKEDAEFVLAFEITDQLTGASVIGSSVTSDRTYYGQLIAARGVPNGENEQRVRILWHAEKRQAFTGGISLSRHPATNAAREFVKALKNAEKQYRSNVGSNVPTETSITQPPPARNSTPKSYEPPKVYGVTLEGYNQLRTGMSYSQVVKIIGAEGVEMSSGGTGRYRTEMYKWSVGYGNLIVMFQNGKLIHKAQSGLP